MNNYLLFAFILGFLFIIIELVKESVKNKDTQIIYRYIPRTFNDNFDDPIPVSTVFKKMFTNPSPWVSGLNSYDEKKQEQVNKYFVTQA